MDLNKELFKESGWWDKKSKISLDEAFKDDSDAGINNCTDIKKKPLSSPPNFKKPDEEKIKENVNLLEQILQDRNQAWLAAYVAKCAESEHKRTQEWAETSGEYKIDHHECEYCGEIPERIESHDILPYYLLTEGQRHNRDFLKQNLISLCYEHHHSVAHLGDPDCIKFDPKIKETCDRKRQDKDELERLREAERHAKNMEYLRSYVENKNMPGNNWSVEKMILPGDKRRP